MEKTHRIHMSTAVVITSLDEIDGVKKLLPTIKKEWAEEVVKDALKQLPIFDQKRLDHFV